MKKYPNIFFLKDLLEMVDTVSTEINGKWIPARPLGYPTLGSRLKAAWMVFTGKADAVVWPGEQ